MDDDVNHEKGDDVPGAWETGCCWIFEFLAGAPHPGKTPLDLGVTEPSRSAHPAMPARHPAWARPTLSPAVQVDEGPVIQGEQGEEGEDGGEDVLEALGVGLVEQRPEHHREEYWRFRATPGAGAGAPPHPIPTPPPPRHGPAPAKDTEAGEHEDEDGSNGRQRLGKVPGQYVEAGQEAVGRGGDLCPAARANPEGRRSLISSDLGGVPAHLENAEAGLHGGRRLIRSLLIRQ